MPRNVLEEFSFLQTARGRSRRARKTLTCNLPPFFKFLIHKFRACMSIWIAVFRKLNVRTWRESFRLQTFGWSYSGASAHTPNLLFRKDPGKRVGPHTNHHPERICSLSIKPITLLIVCILIIIHLPLPLPECISFILRERNVGCKDNSKRYCNNLK